MRKKKIFHLIPHQGIGGVEAAAKTCEVINKKNFYFCCKYLSKQKNNSNSILKIYSLLEIVFSSMKIASQNPDFLLVSLWKSAFSALLVKLFRPNTKLILFLHSAKSVNFLDYQLNYLISKGACEIWGDSETTIQKRSREFNIKQEINKKVISFQCHKLEFNASKNFTPNFIYWGRFHKCKNIELAIKFFYEISKNVKDAKFILIGPDFGELSKLKKIANNLNLNNKIIFYSAMNIFDIAHKARNVSFFLQLSHGEGLAMSIIEAMQFGLIPIVTNVGEINNYCIHNINSIIYSNLNSTSEEVINLINNKKQMKKLRNNAFRKWNNITTYKEDITNSLEALLSKNY